MNYRILLVDDDPLVLATTQSFLNSRGFKVDSASSGTEAIKLVMSSPSTYALVILDYRMEDMDGAETSQAILNINPNLYILINSGDSSREALKSTWKAGAVGFLEKGMVDPEVFLQTVKNWCRKFEETYMSISLTSSLSEKSDLIASLKMVGRSDSMAEIADRVRKYQNKLDNVLILGETGTGKEHIARALHTGPSSTFFAVNCASYSGNTDLMEADLFGYVKGSFTGAQKDHVGIFESAQGGTVFLDEIQSLDLKAQQKLLRAIQEKSVRPVGSVREYTVAFRLIAAAKPELEKSATGNTFLPDLFERLNVLRVDIPALRERPEDIEPLVAYFCEKYFKETGERKTFLRRTVNYLESYSWPRNVRELENMVRRLCVDVSGEKISPEHLDARFFDSSQTAPSLKERQSSVMKKEVEEALTSTSSQREAARKLGMPESSLRNLIKRLGIVAKTKYPSNSSFTQH